MYIPGVQKHSRALAPRDQKICPCDVNQGRPTPGPRKGFEWFTQYFFEALYRVKFGRNGK